MENSFEGHPEVLEVIKGKPERRPTPRRRRRTRTGTTAAAGTRAPEPAIEVNVSPSATLTRMHWPIGPALPPDSLLLHNPHTGMTEMNEWNKILTRSVCPSTQAFLNLSWRSCSGRSRNPVYLICEVAGEEAETDHALDKGCLADDRWLVRGRRTSLSLLSRRNSSSDSYFDFWS